MNHLNELGRRVGLPPTTASPRCAERILESSRQDELQLYDLIFAVRAATKRLTPCASTCHENAETFHLEFWSLGKVAEPELQRTDATLSSLPDGSKLMYLSLAEEPTSAG